MWVVFLQMQKLLIFFSKNNSVYAVFNDQSFNDTLTNDIVSFENRAQKFSYIYTILKWQVKKKVREKSRECHNHKSQLFPDTKRKRKPTNPDKHKSNKRTKSTKISSIFPKRGNQLSGLESL